MELTDSVIHLISYFLADINMPMSRCQSSLSLRPILYVIDMLLGSRCQFCSPGQDAMEMPLHEAPEKGRRYIIQSKRSRSIQLLVA